MAFAAPYPEALVDLTPLFSFVGYGPEKPAIIFLGVEESDGGSGAQALAVRSTQFRQFEDVFEACKKLAEADWAFVNPFAKTGNGVEQWNTAARFRLALAGADWQRYENWSQYWRTRLGRADGDTLLMECFPVPRKGLRIRLQGYNAQQAWKKRGPILRKSIDLMTPQYVIAYGNDACARVEDLVIVVESDHRGTVRKWHPLKAKRASVGRTTSGAVVARVAFFGNGGFKLDELDTIRDAMWGLGRGPIALR